MATSRLVSINANEVEEVKNMANYILKLMGYQPINLATNGTLSMTERTRQYYTWGVRNYLIIKCEDGRYGLQFKVSGLKFQGRVRVFYNRATDYFECEFLRMIKDETLKVIKDICFTDLHAILHCNIERDDDPRV